MSEIKAIYSEEPKFPATDQHPDAVRYKVDGMFVDAIGGEPTSEEMSALLSPPEDSRIEVFEADVEVQELTNRLQTNSPEEIDNWIDNTDNAQVLRAILKYLVAARRRGGA